MGLDGKPVDNLFFEQRQVPVEKAPPTNSPTCSKPEAPAAGAR